MRDDASTNGAGGLAADAPPAVAFRVDARGEARCRRVLARLALRALPAETRSAVLLDSFDRRLGKAGIALELLSAPGAPLEEPSPVRCRLSLPERPPAELELPRAPVFAWDLPHEEARALADVLEARAIGPIGAHEASAVRSAVLDDQEKTVARIEEVSHRVRGPEATSGWHEAERRLVLSGVLGYGAELARLERALRRAAGRRPGPAKPFDARVHLGERRRIRGRWPALAPDARAFDALARIGRAQLEVLLANEAGMRTGFDAEHLHDARVALRRLRSLFGQLRGVYRGKERKRVAAECRWLAGRLGPLRDLDTLLFRMRLVEPELAAELAPAVAEVERVREGLLETLRADLASERWAEARAFLSSRLSTRAASEHGGRRAAKPFVRVLAPRLLRRIADVLERAEAIGTDGAADALHELRIACKKLRYLLECCRGFVPKPELAAVTADLKGLQGVLGRVQDAEVHVELVERLAREELAGSGPRAWRALGRLEERMRADGRDAREHYGELAAALSSPEGRGRLDALVARVAEPPRRRPVKRKTKAR